MEPPAKRQKLSERHDYPRPTRTLDLRAFERPQTIKRSLGKIILPRVPDVTVTAAVLEVAVNGGSTATEIAAPTSDVALTLTSLGTLTVPAVDSSSLLESSSSTLLGTGGSSIYSANSTLSTDRTVTITATSTFRVTYSNGTFIRPSTTYKPKPTESDSESSSVEDLASTYVFGQGVTDTYVPALTTTIHSNTGTTATTSQSAETPKSSSDDSSNSIPPLTPQQTQMVGGIVGGVAGIAFVLIVLLYVLRWYRARLKKVGRLPEQLTSNYSRDFGESSLIESAAPMSQTPRSSFFPTMAPAMKKWRSGSDIATITSGNSSTATDSEKGFQRISGRKIPPVLSTGGDQYGGSYGAFDNESRTPVKTFPFSSKHQHDLSESSFYRDAQGIYIGDGSTASQSAPATPIHCTRFNEKVPNPRRPSLAHTPSRRDIAEDLNRALQSNMAKPDGFAISRNSPARTPVIQSPSTSCLKLPIQAPVTMDEDIPEMPLPSPGFGLGAGMNFRHGHQRIPNRLSTRSAASGTGRFKEELR